MPGFEQRQCTVFSRRDDCELWLIDSPVRAPADSLPAVVLDFVVAARPAGIGRNRVSTMTGSGPRDDVRPGKSGSERGGPRAVERVCCTRNMAAWMPGRALVPAVVVAGCGESSMWLGARRISGGHARVLNWQVVLAPPPRLRPP